MLDNPKKARNLVRNNVVAKDTSHNTNMNVQTIKRNKSAHYRNN